MGAAPPVTANLVPDGIPAMVFYMLIALWLCWGMSYPMSAWALELADPVTLRMLVMPASAAVLLVLLAVAGRKILPARENWWQLVVAALFNMTLFQTLMNTGILMTGPGKTSILVYTMPAWAALFAVLFYGQRLDGRTLIALILGLVAVALVLIGDPSGIQRSVTGALFTLASAAAFGFGTVYMKHVRWRDELLVVGAWQFVFGGLLLIPAALVLHDHLYLDLAQPRGLVGFAYVVLIANALAYYLWFSIIRALPMTVSGLTTLVVPCIGVASSALLTDYDINLYDVAALALVLVSISIVTFDQIFRRKRSAA